MSLNIDDSPEHATPSDPLAAALRNDNNKTISLHRLTAAIRKAARDERIRGLFLTGSFQPADFGTGYACLREVREAIEEFKKGDGQNPKPVYAYLETPTTREYYVASAA